MSEKIILKNAKTFDPKSKINGDKKDILIQNGIIVDKLNNQNDAKIIDATGLIAFPGAIDLHSYWYSPIMDYVRAKSILEEDFATIPTLDQVQMQYLEHGFLTICESDVPMTQSKITIQNMSQNPLIDHLLILELGSNWALFSDLQQEDKLDNITIGISTLLQKIKGYGISISAPYHQQFWKLSKTPESPDRTPILGINPNLAFKQMINASLQTQLHSTAFIQPYDIENEKTEQETSKLLKNLCESIPKDSNNNVKQPIHLSLANHYFTADSHNIIQLYCENDKFEMDVSPLVFGLNRPVLTNLRNLAIETSSKSNIPMTTIDLEFDTEIYLSTRQLKTPNPTYFSIWSKFLEILLQLKKLNRLDKISLSSNSPLNISLTDFPTVFNWLMNPSSRNEVIKMLASSVLGSSPLKDMFECLNLLDIATITAYNPAQSLGIDHRKGHLGIGADADICLFNLNDEIATQNNADASKEIIKGFSSANTIIKKGKIIKEKGIYSSQLENLSVGKIFWTQGNLTRLDKQLIQRVINIKESFFNKHYSMQFSSLENKSNSLEEL